MHRESGVWRPGPGPWVGQTAPRPPSPGSSGQARDKTLLLAHACYSSDASRAADLLARGTDPNEASARGLTALHCACAAGSLSCVELLLKHGARAAAAWLCRTRNEFEELTAFQVARALGHDACALALVPNAPSSHVGPLSSRIAAELSSRQERIAAEMKRELEAAGHQVVALKALTPMQAALRRAELGHGGSRSKGTNAPKTVHVVSADEMLEGGRIPTGGGGSSPPQGSAALP